MPEVTTANADKYARSIGFDAGRKHCRAHGRTKWNEDDWNAACDAYEQFYKTFQHTANVMGQALDQWVYCAVLNDPDTKCAFPRCTCGKSDDPAPEPGG